MTGVVAAGVESGSYVLTCDPGAAEPTYQLGAAGKPWCGRRVQVVGTALPGVLTIMMQGVPMRVEHIEAVAEDTPQ